jgi:hypothetical protein
LSSSKFWSSKKPATIILVSATVVGGIATVVGWMTFNLPRIWKSINAVIAATGAWGWVPALLGALLFLSWVLHNYRTLDDTIWRWTVLVLGTIYQWTMVIFVYGGISVGLLGLCVAIKESQPTRLISKASGAASEADGSNSRPDIAYFSGYLPQRYPAVRTDPTEITDFVRLSRCRQYAEKDDYEDYRFEGDALRKMHRFGPQGLDSDDRKWISAYDNRKAACQWLLQQNGQGWEQVKARLRSWLE